MRSQKKTSKFNAALHTLIVLEAILLIVLLIASVAKPKNTIHFSPTDFFIETNDGITADDSAIYFRNTDEEISSKRIYLKNYYSIPSGAYDITANYASRVSEYNSIYDIPVNLTISAGNALIYADGIGLDDSNTSVTRTFWIPLSSDVDEFNVTLEYYETGELDFFGIDITERISYRFMRLAGLALIFLLIDLIIYFFFTNGVKKSEKTALVLIFGATVLVSSLPLLSDYLLQAHDMHFHMVRIASVAAEIKKGVFPVRMMSEMCNGYGYANSLYYCDFFLYIPALLHNLALPLQTCYKLYAVSINTITMLISYYSFKHITKDHKIGALGAILYTLSAYRLTNLHVRSALGEYTAMAFFPLVILGMYRIYTAERPNYRDWLPLALGMSAIIMSHILSVEMVAIFLGIFCIVYIKRTLNSSRLMSILKAIGVTLALTAWFLVPFLQSYTQMKTLVTESDTRWIQSSGVDVLQLLGFKPHDAMYICEVYFESEEKLLLTMGISVLTGVVVMFFCLYKHSEWKDHNKRLFYTLCTTGILGIIATVFSLKYFPWTKIQKLCTVVFGDKLGDTLAGLIGSLQFSWRFLSIATVLFAVGTVFALTILKKHLPKAVRTASLILAVAIVFGTFNFYTDFSKVKLNWHFYTMSNLDSSNVMNGEYYLENTDTSALGSAIPTTISGNAEITRYENNDGIFIDCRNTGDFEAVIDIPVFAYNNYHAYDENGNELAISKSPVNNRIAITLPEGYSGTVSVKYVSPALWRVCEVVSAITMLTLVAFAIKKLIDERRFSRNSEALDPFSDSTTSCYAVSTQKNEIEKDKENE